MLEPEEPGTGQQAEALSSPSTPASMADDDSSCGSPGVVCEPGTACAWGMCVERSIAMRERARASSAPEPALGPLVAATWTERTPGTGGTTALGGRLTGLVVDLADASRQKLLVASPGGGLWRRNTDTSAFDTVAMYGFGERVLTHLEYDLHVTTPRRLWVVGQSSLGWTTNLGDTVTPSINSGGGPSQQLLPSQHFLEHPRPFAQMIRGSTRWVFYSYGCYGLYYSNDTDPAGGLTFSLPHAFFTGTPPVEDNCIGALAADPVGGRLYFATLRTASPARVFQTGVWNDTAPALETNPTPISTGITGSLPIQTLTPTGASDRVLAIRGSNVWRTTTGTSWSPVASLGSSRNRVTLHTGYGEELLAGNVAFEWNGNVSSGPWSFLSAAPEGLYSDIGAIFIHPTAGSYRVWATTDSSNYGTQANLARWSWSPGTPPGGTGPGGTILPGQSLSEAGLRVFQAHFAGLVKGASSSALRRLWLGGWDTGAVRLDDTLGSSAYALHTGSESYSFQSSPTSPSRAWHRWNGASHGQRIDNALGTPTVTSFVLPGAALPLSMSHQNLVAVDPTNASGDVVYFLGSANSVHYTTTGGNPNAALCPTVPACCSATGTLTCFQTWVGPTPGGQLSSITVDDTGTVYVGTQGNGVWKRSGSSWVSMGTLATPQPAAVLGLAYTGPSGSRVWWAATTQGVYRRDPATGSWTRKHWTGLGYSYSDVAVDPNCTKRVYVAMGWAGDTSRAFHVGNVLVTTNDGDTWTSVSAGSGVHASPITDVQPDWWSSRYLYVASWGRGLWVYDRGTTSCP